MTLFLGFSIVQSLLFAWLRHHKKDKASSSQAELLLDEFGPILIRRCYRILRDDDLAKDAMQEVAITLLKDFEQFRGDQRQVLAWLYRVTTNHCLQLLRREKRWKEKVERLVLEVEFSSPSNGEDVERKLAMQDFLQKLDHDEAAAVLLRFVSGMTQQEVAEVMGVNRDQVRRWLRHFQHRGRVLLREWSHHD